ncbi:nucleotide exchange factor GrpE [Fimbriiglobus ruber]|uniref:Protein GrpE n=1 Tax=Fimbriiglobus ruber TaxID=1908690 RepID=A0A225DK34_9BACT|nr:nucleotide exchange factor GrpE [Fimbriiglobus ruber]OWK41732.1 Heat shock protein GrpE [Fimbriiglobus ruber]
MTDSQDLPPTADGPAGADDLRARVGVLEKQVTDYKLLIADFENSRKRLAQDAERQRKYAYEPLVRDLLNALDNLNYAAQAAKQAGDTGPLARGVSATINLFLEALKRHGVSRIDVAPGSPFDAHSHQAVMQQPTNDFEPGTVVAVTQNGFVLHDRVIRPASVVVASEPPAGGE